MRNSGWTPARMLVAGLLAVLGCRQDAESPTAPEPAPALATTATTALAFYQVSGGYLFTCGLTTDNRAYCWGNNVQGAVGDGTTIERRTPVPVAGTLRFRQVSAGYFNTCAVTTDFHAYCWGTNVHGVLGDGTTTRRLRPVPVAGVHRFRTVESFGYHTCGVSYPDDRAYCWGENFDGQVGDGTRIDRLTPVAVTGALVFHQLTAGYKHSCGVTTDARMFCWGSNQYGQVGDSSTATRRLKPSRVGRTRSWHQVDAGGNTSCAVATTNGIFCWGDGRDGEFGNGKLLLSFWPRIQVDPRVKYHRVTVGWKHTCGEAISGASYCWGSNLFGQLGSSEGLGSRTTFRTTVIGGHEFAQLSAGGFHTCGKTLAGVAYCWGSDDHGQLGDGTTTDSFTPVAVAAPAP
jgi:alpha-tubulin suppressor-like RCC1 family protein